MYIYFFSNWVNNCIIFIIFCWFLFLLHFWKNVYLLTICILYTFSTNIAKTLTSLTLPKITKIRLQPFSTGGVDLIDVVFPCAIIMCTSCAVFPLPLTTGYRWSWKSELSKQKQLKKRRNKMDLGCALPYELTKVRRAIWINSNVFVN